MCHALPMEQKQKFSSKYDNLPYLTQLPKSNKERKHAPWHRLDSNTFSVFSEKINTVKIYGDFKVKWVLEECQSIQKAGDLFQPTVNTWYNEIKLCSYKNTPWFETCSLMAMKLDEEFKNAILVEKTLQQKERTNARSRARRLELKKEAEKLGISLKALKEKNRAEKPKYRCTKKDIKHTKKLIAIGPVLYELKTELEDLLKNIAENPKNTNIVYQERYTRNIKNSISFIKEWNKKT